MATAARPNKPKTGPAALIAAGQSALPTAVGQPAPPGGAAGSEGAPVSGQGEQAWLVTFTDLVALLITFFVMLFAMSQVEERKWQNLTDALSRNLSLVRDITVALPVEDLDIDTVEFLPGTDLDYLALLLEQHMASEAVLAGGALRRQDDRIVMSLPGELLFAPNSATLSEEGARAAFALTSVLRNLENRIEVTGSADPTRPGGGFRSNWELSLARAARVATLLSDSGYRRPVVTRGLGDSRFGQLSQDLVPAQRRALGRRVDITIHQDAGELRR